MNKTEFVTSVDGQLRKYISLSDEYGKNAQIRVNPALLLVDLLSEKQYLQAIEFSEEVIENGAYGEGDATESADGYQATQDPEFFPVSNLLMKSDTGELVPNPKAIEEVADRYFS